jgi:hypothetical protein
MTTIDKAGNIVSQLWRINADGKRAIFFAAIAKQIIHFKTDITTSMAYRSADGTFHLLQFGSIGEEEQTIAEIVQGMYYEGYDFNPFLLSVHSRYGVRGNRSTWLCDKSVSKKATAFEHLFQFRLTEKKHPKLTTMLFIAHAGATAANAGKIYFTKNPMAINYPQWLAFAKNFVFAT